MSSGYRWVVLAVGTFAQASFAAVNIGLPALAPALRSHYSLSLTQIGVVLGAVSAGMMLTLLPWGIVADRIGERVVIVAGLTGAAVALAALGWSGSFLWLVGLLAVAGVPPAPPAHNHALETGPLRDPLMWLLSGGSSLLLVAQISNVFFLVLFLHQHRGVSATRAAAVLAVTQLLGAVARIASGRWSDRTERRIVPLRQLAAALGVTTALVAVVPVGFAAIVGATSWRIGFALAAVCPLLGWLALAPLAEPALQKGDRAAHDERAPADAEQHRASPAIEASDPESMTGL